MPAQKTSGEDHQTEKSNTVVHIHDFLSDYLWYINFKYNIKIQWLKRETALKGNSR